MSESRVYLVKNIAIFDSVSQSCMYELHCRRFQNREVEIVYRSLALNLDLANLILPYKYVLAT